MYAHTHIQAVWVMEFTINGLRWNLDGSLMDTASAFCKCVLSEQSHAHTLLMCTECSFLPSNHLSVYPFFVFICVWDFSESLSSTVTFSVANSSVVTVNFFLRADEIEMVMTDLERANQVTCSTSLLFHATLSNLSITPDSIVFIVRLENLRKY